MRSILCRQPARRVTAYGGLSSVLSPLSSGATPPAKPWTTIDNGVLPAKLVWLGQIAALRDLVDEAVHTRQTLRGQSENKIVLRTGDLL